MDIEHAKKKNQGGKRVQGINKNNQKENNIRKGKEERELEKNKHKMTKRMRKKLREKI